MKTRILLHLVAVAALVTTGCSGGAKTNAPSTDAGHAGHAGHAHPTQGPHQGDLIELGDEEFHAELVHDEKAETLTIYILDGAAAKQVPIEAAEITINAKHDGEPKQFTLPAAPDESAPKGMSSRFVSSDPLLTRHNEETADARLVVTINGKSYRGVIAHDHEH